LNENGKFSHTYPGNLTWVQVKFSCGHF